MEKANRVHLRGEVITEPKMHTVKDDPNGLIKFRLETRDIIYAKGGDGKREVVQSHNVVAFGYMAKSIEQFVRKGANIVVEGSVHYRNFTLGDEKKTTTEIRVSEWYIVP